MATETLPTPRWASKAYERPAFLDSIRTLDPRLQSLQRDDSGPIDDDDIRASIETAMRVLSPSQTVSRLYRQLQAIWDTHSTNVFEGRSRKSIARQQSEERWQQLYDRLTSFSSLGEGWDGYSAAPPTKLACENAREFVEVLLLGELVPSRCKPSVVGGVGVTLKKGCRRVYVEFYNDGSAHSLKSDGTGEPITERVGTGYSQYLRFIRGIADYLNA